MKKTLSIGCNLFLLFFFCLNLCFSSAVWAKNFGNFSITIPDTWQVSQDVNTYVFTAPQATCAFSVIVAPHQDTPFREFVIGFYQNLKGAHAKNIDNGVTFDTHMLEKVSGKARVTMQSKNFAVVAAMGQCFEHNEILHSLVILDENKQPLKDSTRPYPLLENDR